MDPRIHRSRGRPPGPHRQHPVLRGNPALPVPQESRAPSAPRETPGTPAPRETPGTPGGPAAQGRALPPAPAALPPAPAALPPAPAHRASGLPNRYAEFCQSRPVTVVRSARNGQPTGFDVEGLGESVFSVQRDGQRSHARPVAGPAPVEFFKPLEQRGPETASEVVTLLGQVHAIANQGPARPPHPHAEVIESAPAVRR